MRPFQWGADAAPTAAPNPYQDSWSFFFSLPAEIHENRLAETRVIITWTKRASGVVCFLVCEKNPRSRRALPPAGFISHRVWVRSARIKWLANEHFSASCPAAGAFSGPTDPLLEPSVFCARPATPGACQLLPFVRKIEEAKRVRFCSLSVERPRS